MLCLHMTQLNLELERLETKKNLINTENKSRTDIKTKLVHC